MPGDRLRIVSWNVNGLRACRKRTPFRDVRHLLESLNADIVCLQETKLRRAEVVRELAVVDGWDSFFSCTLGNRGYSGTATFVKTSCALPFASEDGFTGCNGRSADAAERLMAPHKELVERYSVEELQELDAEGRVVVTDHGAFVLFNVYGPAITASDSEAAAARCNYKLRFYGALQTRWDELARRGRAVIVVGDLNICIAPADTCDLKFSLEGRPDRLWLRRLLGFPTPEELSFAPPPAVQFQDAFRCFFPRRPAAYTVWSTATAARINNHGQRIDLTLVAGLPMSGDKDAQEPSSSNSSLYVSAADIAPEVEGSDHCPVWVELGGGPIPVALTAPPGAQRHIFSDKQVTLRNWLSREPSCKAEQPPSPSSGTAADEGDSGQDGGYMPQPCQLLRGAKEVSTVETSSSSVASGSMPANELLSVTIPKAAARSETRQTGLKTLRSFFKVAPSQPEPKQSGDNFTSSSNYDASAAPKSSAADAPPSCRESSAVIPDSEFLAAEAAAAEVQRSESVSEAKNAWAKIHSKMEAPRCRHGETAALKRTNKSGDNKGRWFYTCARPAGPPPHGDCGFFQWVEKRPSDRGPQMGAWKRPKS